MPEMILKKKAPFEWATAALVGPGRALYALAIAGLGVETLVCARRVDHSLGPQYAVIPALLWLPAMPSVAYLFGAIWVACAAGLHPGEPCELLRSHSEACCLRARWFSTFRKMPLTSAVFRLRTTAFEPLALASLAWLLLGGEAKPRLLPQLSRYVLALSLILFGVDHFLALIFIANLIPNWIPWHVFWVAFFGVALIASGLSIGLNLLRRWAAAGIGVMFGIWVVTLHIPRVLGLYGIPGAPQNPNEWSSLLIAIGLWGGLWAMAAV